MTGKNNLSLWESLSTTDQKYTKPSSQGGHQSTSINGQYMIMRATEAFGACGIGWGYDVIEERFDEGEEVYRIADGKTEVIGAALNHTIKLKLWFKFGGEKGEVTDYGHTPYKYWSQKSSRWICDGEASKKSLTDAIKRCLSKIGVCADIFLGEFDNSHYKQEAANEIAREREVKAIEAQEKRQSEQEAAFNELLAEIEALADMDEMNAKWALISRKMAAKLSESQQAQVQAAAQAKVNSWGAK